MNIQIITSSYPAFKGDPSGTAGLFVQSFAEELVAQGHKVVVQPVARKKSYQAESGVIIEPIPWEGGDQELASMNFLSPLNWLTFLKFFVNGKKHTSDVHEMYKIDRTLCMWIVPCGLFGYWMKRRSKREYDVWALGSDVWKVRRIPFFGEYWIKKVVQNASGVFADGIKLAGDVKAITQKDCRFLPSARRMPRPQDDLVPLQPQNACHLLFVGRYHENKGPDLLIRAISEIERDKRQNLRVHLFGTGPLEASLYEMCGRLKLGNVVTIDGPINDQQFADYLSRVSFLVIPSRIESIPLVFSDALQVGTPVVSTPVGDLPHLIRKYACGILSHDTSPRALSQAIKQAMRIQKKEFRESVQKASGMFGINDCVDQWLEERSAVIRPCQKGSQGF